MSFLSSWAAIVQGDVKTIEGEMVPYAVVRVESLNVMTRADITGHYQLELVPGEYTITAEYFGFGAQSQKLIVKNEKKITLHFKLEEISTELSSVEIYAYSRNVAKEVMEKAIDAASSFREKYEKIEMDAYVKTSLYKYGPDTTRYENKDSVPENRPYIYIQDHLQETYSHIVSDGSNRFKQVISGVKDYSKYPTNNMGISVTVGPDLGEHEIIPQQWMYSNTYVLNSNSAYLEYDLNEPLLDLPGLAEKKYLSPLAPTAMLNYRFELAGTFTRDSVKYYRITVSPFFKSEALFEGTIHIQENTWALVYVNLEATPRSMKFFKKFRLEQELKEVEPSVFFPQNRKIEYEIKEGRSTYFGSVTIDHANIDFPESFPDKTFSDETQTYEETAFDVEEDYWINKRATSFDTLEVKYIALCDSLQAKYNSEEYLFEQDSSYNSLRFLDFILYGIGYRNRVQNYQFYIYPLIMQVNPVGIGGYRHRIGGSFEKEFANAYTLETTSELDYGFRNRDIRGKMGVGLTYIPKKFVRTFVRFGDYYDMINSYASLGSIFSRSNYVRTQSISVAQRMEVINGLFAELSFEFSDQKPISNLAQDLWSARIFGELNAPLDFDRYFKSEIRLDLKYRFKQKYIIKKNKKIILGTKYPEIGMVYRKGIPGLFKSEVNFDYIEFSATHDVELGRWGTAEWSFLMGSFINKRNLRILEHRFFRGSDFFFFSDPLRSFQLLGPTLSTPNPFIRANYFHHLNGILLNKIPLISRLKLTEAVGAGFLSIPDQQFNHAEVYVGLERIVRIRKELFRFGIFGATSDSSIENIRLEFKLGVNFYNSFTKKWSY